MNGITVADLSPDQREVYEAVIDWTGDSRGIDVMTLGGFAGSGKSTLVSLVASTLPAPIAFCAYTGKASSVLKRKLHAAGMFTVSVQKANRDGSPSIEPRPYCGTIHSLIYRMCECREPKTVSLNKPCPEKGCDAELGAPVDKLARCARGHEHRMTVDKYDAIKPRTAFVYAEKDEEGRCTKCFGKEWLRRESLDRSYSLIIVDEASMVDDMMLRDLKSYGVPILAVGDHGQLPPVGGAGSLMKNPMLRLEKIHRQAEGNPIIALSKMIRETGRLPEDWRSLEDADGSEAVTFGKLRTIDSFLEERYANASPERLLAMGLACYTNRRRMGLNVSARRALGTARVGRELPRSGEHVVCLRNMKTRNGGAPIFNGMRGVLTTDANFKQHKNGEGKVISTSETHLVGSVAFPDDDIEAREYEMLAGQFNREKTFAQPEELARETGIHTFAMAGALFDFGFAMTVHKMQGSQFEDLVVCVERPGPVGEEDWRRWLYTAVTRASVRLTVLR